jgi:uncharacterized protein (DUF4415 family)
VGYQLGETIKNMATYGIDPVSNSNTINSTKKPSKTKLGNNSKREVTIRMDLD